MELIIGDECCSSLMRIWRKRLFLFLMYFIICGCKEEAFKKFRIERESANFCKSSSSSSDSLCKFFLRKLRASSTVYWPNLLWNILLLSLCCSSTSTSLQQIQ